MNGARSYRVTELLGRGAFGAVYLADTVGTGISRPVAIKVLRPEQAAIPGLIERLRDEARMLSMIRHRAIVRVDDLVELDGRWSVVMEYIEGCDVAALVAEGPLPPRVALAIAEEIANALHVASTQLGPDGRPIRLVHRDVKPGNIRVTAQGEVKLLDFGVARADFSAREAGASTAVYGTPTYMAPERFRGDDTFAGDVYALGVTLFEMLAGEPPGQSPMELERVPPGIKLAGAWRQIRETSVPLRDLICAMLAHSPEERPTARDCARALARIRGQLGGMILEDWAERVVPPAVRARERTPDGRVGSVMLERQTQPSLRMQGVPPERSWGAMVAAMGTLAVLGIGALVLLVVGAGAWWIWRTESARAPEPVVTTVTVAPVAGAAVGPDGGGGASGAAATDAAGTSTVAASPAIPVDVPVATPPAGGASAVAASAPVATTAAPKPNATTAATSTSSPTRPVAASTSATAPRSPPRTAQPDVAQNGDGTVSGARALPRTGIVALDGQASALILTGRAGVYGAGEVAVGEYTADVTLTNGETLQLKEVTVNPARVTTVWCDTSVCRETEGW